MMWGYYDMGWGLWLLWLIPVIVGIGLLVFVLVRLATHPRSSESRGPGAVPPPDATDPRRILQERYARGEIDTEEFTERMRTLDGR